MDSGDYDDPDDYPDLAERLEAYKSEYILLPLSFITYIPYVDVHVSC